MATGQQVHIAGGSATAADGSAATPVVGEVQQVVSGIASYGEIDNSTTPTGGLVIYTATGIKGITIRVLPFVARFDAATPASIVTHVAVQFLPSTASDSEVPGHREIVPMSEEKTFFFRKPYPMKLLIDTMIAGAQGAEVGTNESVTQYKLVQEIL